jgi:hypothetical protein
MKHHLLVDSRHVVSRLRFVPPSIGRGQASNRPAVRELHRGCVVRWFNRCDNVAVATLLEELADGTLAGTRKAYLTELATVPLLIIDGLGMRKLAHTAAEDLLERSCDDMNAPQHRSHPTLPSMTGASCWATPPRSPRSSIDYYITRTSSNAGREAGVRSCTPTCVPRTARSRTHRSRPSRNVGFARPVNVGFEPSTEAVSRHTP